VSRTCSIAAAKNQPDYPLLEARIEQVKKGLVNFAATGPDGLDVAFDGQERREHHTQILKEFHIARWVATEVRDFHPPLVQAPQHSSSKDTIVVPGIAC